MKNLKYLSNGLEKEVFRKRFGSSQPDIFTLIVDQNKKVHIKWVGLERGWLDEEWFG